MKKIQIFISVIITLLVLFNISYITKAVDNNPILPTNNSFDKQLIYRYNQKNMLCSTICDNYQGKSCYHPNELIVAFKEKCDISPFYSSPGFIATGIPSIDALNKKYKILDLKHLFIEYGIPEFTRYYKVVFPENTDFAQAIQDYAGDPAVDYVELNYRYQAMGLIEDNKSNMSLTPNDPLFSQQWALNQSNDCDIDAPEAWAIETGSPDIVIAVIDSGIDYNHPDLATNIWNNTDEIPNNGIDDDHNGFIDDIRGWDFLNNDNDPMDDAGHGTVCSGIIGAVTNNSIGMSGICWHSKIMALKFLDADGYGYMTDAINATLYAIMNGADVISMSYGYYATPMRLEHEVIDYAFSNGVALVAAAGNDNVIARSFPAGYDNVIAVSGTDKTDNRTSWAEWGWGSNWGDWIDVAAPSVDILSTAPGNHYGKVAGTSAACPHVAAVAGLLLSHNPDCPYSAQMVKSVIRYTTDEITADPYIGTGRINAYKALTQTPFAINLQTIPNWQDVKGTVNVQGTAWAEDFLYFTLEIGDDENPTSWTLLLNSSTPTSGTLYTLDTATLKESVYIIRLHLVCGHGAHTEEMLMYVNNEADGNYDADIYVSNCYDSSTPGWRVKFFGSVQDAVNKARIGDTIFVYDGLYTESVNIEGLLKSSLSLIGQSNKWTIISGLINVKRTQKVSIDGFNLGIKSEYPWNNTYNNAVPLYVFGNPPVISIAFSSKCVISNNSFLGYYNLGNIGVVFSSHIIIKNNNVSQLYFDPTPSGGGQPYSIDLKYSSKSVVSGNKLLYTPGVASFASHTNAIINNMISYCMDGISLFQGTLNTLIYKNSISGGQAMGVNVFELTFGNTIVVNSITACTFGFFGWHFGANSIFLNNFEKNARNCLDDGINHFYSLQLKNGNYWNDYTGIDSNSDGIGDTPYAIKGMMGFTRHYDRFPLMNPVDIENVTVVSAERFIQKLMEWI